MLYPLWSRALEAGWPQLLPMLTMNFQAARGLKRWWTQAIGSLIVLSIPVHSFHLEFSGTRRIDGDPSNGTSWPVLHCQGTWIHNHSKVCNSFHITHYLWIFIQKNHHLTGAIGYLKHVHSFPLSYCVLWPSYITWLLSKVQWFYLAFFQKWCMAQKNSNTPLSCTLFIGGALPLTMGNLRYKY